MAYIDPEGMFGGDRMAMLTDKTRWVWPWLWCASNGAGRIELNFRTVSERAFRQFKNRPTEEQFWEWIKEFNDSYLLFVYQTDSGQLWGQWNVTDKYLPRFKKKADSTSPAPNARAILEWNRQYEELKKQRSLDKCHISNVGKAEPQETKEEPAQKGRQTGLKGPNSRTKKADAVNHIVCNAEKAESDANGEFREITLDVDVDVDVDVTTKPFCPAETAGPNDRPSERRKQTALECVGRNGGHPQQNGVPKITKKQRTSGSNDWIEAHHDQFYAAFWRRVKKVKSLAAYTRRVAKLVSRGSTRDEAAAFLLNAIADDRKRFETTRDWEWRQNMHPSTWLNGENWTDEAPPDPNAPPKNLPPPKPIKTVPYDPMALWKAQKLAEQEEEQLEVKVQ